MVYSLREGRTHSLIDVMQRPVALAEFVWSVTDTSNTTLGQYTNPTSILNQPMMMDKLRGFYGYRGKMVLRVQVNAQRFQQGRLLIHYLPLYSSQVGARVQAANANLVFKTQQPRIDLDLSTDTESCLAIPFVYPFEYFDLNSMDPTLGDFFVTVYSPLVSPGGPTDVGVTVWGHLEDVELAYPTTLRPEIFEAQMAGKRKDFAGSQSMGTSSSELSVVGAGPISSLFSRVSKSAAIMGEIPLLSSFALPASWVAGVVSRAASALGFSNPSSSSPATRVLPIRTPYSNNSTAVDNSVKFGLLADNSVEVLPGFAGTDIDELDIRHVCSIPSYIKAFQWPVSSGSGTILYSMGMCPATMINEILAPITTGTLNTWLPSPVAYVSNLFRYWRGSFCITLKVVKTEFHTGRLIVAWIPGVTSDPAFSDISPVYKEVLDLRSSNEFCVCIPFVSIKPWREIDESTGRLVVYVLNELRAPDTVAQTVEVLVEVSGGPDFEVAQPHSNGRTPVIGNFTAQIDDGFVFSAQVAGEDVASKAGDCVSGTVPGPIASSSIYSGGLGPSRFCIGECVRSLRLLLKRSTTLLRVPLAATNRIFMDPFYIGLPLFNPGSNPVFPTHSVDYWSYLGSVFAFSRGGMRIKWWSVDEPILYGARLTVDTAAFVLYWVSGGSGTPALSNAVFSEHGMTGALEIEVPMYLWCHARMNRTGYGTTPAAKNSFCSTAVVEFAHNSATDINCQFYRQTSDDTELGFFYGALPLIPSSGVLGAPGSWY